MPYHKVYGSKLSQLTMGNGVVFRAHRFETSDTGQQKTVETSQSWEYGKLWRISATLIGKPTKADAVEEIPSSPPHPDPPPKPGKAIAGTRGSEQIEAPPPPEPEPMPEPVPEPPPPPEPVEDPEEEEVVEIPEPEPEKPKPRLPTRKEVHLAKKKPLVEWAEAWDLDVEGMTRPQVQKALIKVFDPIWGSK